MLMGAHIAPHVRTRNPSALVLLALFVSSFLSLSAGLSDREALVRFKNSLANPTALNNWDISTNPCEGNRNNWVGLICMNGTIWGLQLENMRLAGLVNIEALSEVHTLRTISLMNNNFEGRMPDIRRLGYLKALFLSNNRFSGEIPNDAFAGMGSLKKVYLANNAFTGQIPNSLTILPRLMILRLEDNQFSGKVPAFLQPDLKVVSLANNELEGAIPASLSNMPLSAFEGNKKLCGQPLKACLPSPPPANPPPPSVLDDALITRPTTKRITPPLLLAFIIICALIILVIVVTLLILCSRKRKAEPIVMEDPNANLASITIVGVPGESRKVPESGAGAVKKSNDNGKLSFLRDDVERFDLQDMLRASAEVLGSGTFGASYKAVMRGGVALVVKRYKMMNNIGREEFHDHMRRLGRLDHPNLLPIVAYYYRKEEKLLVARYVENSSLATHLHRNHTLNKPSLEWRIRLKIIKGVAKGLAYLYNELPSLVVPHGQLKSSNVLLNDSFEPLLTDYALRPAVNQEHAHTLMTAYKSPEYSQTGRITKKTDIWCLGILTLEVLTGKIPENFLAQKYDPKTSLAFWVNTMVEEKRLGEVFDMEMGGTKDCKGQMYGLLKIGLSCCEEDVDQRPDLLEVIARIEELKNYTDDEDVSSTLGELNAGGQW